MKTLNLLLFYSLCLLSSIACQAAAPVALSVEVASPARAAKKLNIDNVYRMLQLAERQYYAGFSIDAKGINHPVLIEFDTARAQQRRWDFAEIISDIFIFNGHISVLLDSGQSFSLIKDAWVLNPQDLMQNARVVFSDGLTHVIVCSPSSLFKAASPAAGCVSINPHWTLSFPWQDIEPQVCGDFLYAVTWSKTQPQHLRIDPVSGKILQQSAYQGEPVCTP